jgi:hypothetical protein
MKRDLHHPSRREESNSGGAPLRDIADHGLVCTNSSKSDDTFLGKRGRSTTRRGTKDRIHAGSRYTKLPITDWFVRIRQNLKVRLVPCIHNQKKRATAPPKAGAKNRIRAGCRYKILQTKTTDCFARFRQNLKSRFVASPQRNGRTCFSKEIKTDFIITRIESFACACAW